MAWLDDHPPARSQFRRLRRSHPSGVVVVHTAENTPDFVAFDGGAEAVANFIRTRSDPGSYHDLSDSDSTINLVAYDCEAFHDGTGSNPHSYGVSMATRADVWPFAPREWREATTRNAARASARYARWLKKNFGIDIPARRISRHDSEQRKPGFLAHAQRDPERRTDPGEGFQWDLFLDTYAQEMGWSGPPAPMEELEMLIVDCPGKPALFLGGAGGVEKINTHQRDALRTVGVVAKRVDPNTSDALYTLADKGTSELKTLIGDDQRRTMLIAAGVYGAFDNAEKGRVAELENKVDEIHAMLKTLTS